MDLGTKFDSKDASDLIRERLGLAGDSALVIMGGIPNLVTA